MPYGGRVLAVDRLARSLDGLSEVPIKLAFLKDSLSKGSAHEVVSFLALSLGAPWRGKGSDELALLALWILAGPGSSDVRRDALASAAHRASMDDVGFFVAPRMPSVPPMGRLAMPYVSDRPLTLGQRKSLARGGERELLQRILKDPSRDVIAIVLKSPHVRSEDVVRLAARRPTHPPVLEAVLSEMRWAFHYDVRLALVQNPHLPLGLAVPLCACLRHHHAKEVARAANLRPEVRQGAERVLRRADESTH